MGDYHDLYLKTGVFLLADVFETFINTCLEYYVLDSCHYFSSPGLSWDVMLKNNDTKLELILDIDIHLFIEIGKKSGVSYIAKIYSKTKNKCMKSHDPNKPSKSITHLDIDNLYGQAISKYFPYGNLSG